MGKDGAAQLKVLHDIGYTTIAQDKETSTVFGMPGEAVRLGATSHVLPANSIAYYIFESLAGSIKKAS